jgi:hypothetical protein
MYHHSKPSQELTNKTQLEALKFQTHIDFIHTSGKASVGIETPSSIEKKEEEMQRKIYVLVIQSLD